jgi:AraC-like DNA-binding protein
MQYLELAPSPPLRPYVRLLWCLELETPGEFGPPERIAPDGIVEMVFHYGVPFAVRFAREPFARQPRSSLVSQTRRFMEIEPCGPTGMISARFHPWGGHHFFEPPVSELADQVVPAEDVWGGGVRELEERLAGAIDVQERVALVERFLLRKLARHHKRHVEGLVREVWNRKGEVRIARLCRELGLTERTLQRIFRDAIGMSPKGFARLTRFLHACAVLRRGRWTSLTQVGQDCSYYDQAHFIEDFRAFAGMTPGQFLNTPRVSFYDID